jgi:hypothetical protein
VPVESIAEDLLGLSIHEAEMRCSGALVPARREIWLNTSDRARERRPRFTLAHEVGHWTCHAVGGRSEPIYCRAGDLDMEVDRLLEREANVFAAELLMPEPESAPRSTAHPTWRASRRSSTSRRRRCSGGSTTSASSRSARRGKKITAAGRLRLR